MTNSIYRHLDHNQAISAGYFEPKEAFRLLNKDWLASLEHNLITRSTQVIYFPGSFGDFHEGHISICREALKKYPDAVLVISPSNSDYAVEKYGAWSKFASNKHRYQAIKRAFPDAVIDFDPMLNMACDQNVDVLLENFLNAHGQGLSKMDKPPIILVGKDRGAFLELNKVTDWVTVEHFPDSTGQSTSNFTNEQRPKKHLYLRCENESEYELFCQCFEDQYTAISPIYLAKELDAAKFAAVVHGCTHTICKEYFSFLSYIPVSRTFGNPLEDAIFPWVADTGITPDMKILDSDVYSGATKRFIQGLGAGFVALADMETLQETHELLDISDFRKKNFAYPWVDVSSRCSMQAFDHAFHERYNAFREVLKYV